MRRLALLGAVVCLASFSRAGEGPGGPPGPGFGRGPVAPRGIERLRSFDQNRDGVISREEFKGPAERFDILDQNRDGKIDATELPPLRLLGPGAPPPDQPAGPQPPVEKPQKAQKPKPQIQIQKPQIQKPQKPQIQKPQKPQIQKPQIQKPQKPPQPAVPGRPKVKAAPGQAQDVAAIGKAIKSLGKDPGMLRKLMRDPEVRAALARIRAFVQRGAAVGPDRRGAFRDRTFRDRMMPFAPGPRQPYFMPPRHFGPPRVAPPVPPQQQERRRWQAERLRQRLPAEDTRRI